MSNYFDWEQAKIRTKVIMRNRMLGEIRSLPFDHWYPPEDGYSFVHLMFHIMEDMVKKEMGLETSSEKIELFHLCRNIILDHEEVLTNGSIVMIMDEQQRPIRDTVERLREEGYTHVLTMNPDSLDEAQGWSDRFTPTNPRKHTTAIFLGAAKSEKWMRILWSALDQSSRKNGLLVFMQPIENLIPNPLTNW